MAYCAVKSFWPPKIKRMDIQSSSGEDSTDEDPKDKSYKGPKKKKQKISHSASKRKQPSRGTSRSQAGSKKVIPSSTQKRASGMPTSTSGVTQVKVKDGADRRDAKSKPTPSQRARDSLVSPSPRASKLKGDEKISSSSSLLSEENLDGDGSQSFNLEDIKSSLSNLKPLPSRSTSPPSAIDLSLTVTPVPLAPPGHSVDQPVAKDCLHGAALCPNTQPSIDPLPSQNDLGQPTQKIDVIDPATSTSCDDRLTTPSVVESTPPKTPQDPPLASTAHKTAEQVDRMNVDEIGSVSSEEIQRHLTFVHEEQELSKLDNPLDQTVETADVSIQPVPQARKLVDKGVDTVSLDTQDLLSSNGGMSRPLRTSPDTEQELLGTSPPAVPVIETPDVTIIDLPSRQQPSIAPAAELEISSAPTGLLTSMMQNMADLLVCSSGGLGVKGKAPMVNAVQTTNEASGLPIASTLLQEFKMMKDDIRKDLETNRAQMDSMVRLHRMELDSLKDELRASEGRYQREAEGLRRWHQQEIESLVKALSNRREQDSADVESRSSMFELLDLRRRVLALEGHSQPFPIYSMHSSSSTRPIYQGESDVMVTRRINTHPLGHLFEANDGYVPRVPVVQRSSSDGFMSVSNPGTPMRYSMTGKRPMQSSSTRPSPYQRVRPDKDLSFVGHYPPL